MNVDINRLVELAKLDLTSEEVEKLEKDMESIIELMDTIKTVPLDENDNEDEATSMTVLREDTVGESLPATHFTNLSIPKVVE